jgi:hypothetical protein
MLAREVWPGPTLMDTVLQVALRSSTANKTFIALAILRDRIRILGKLCIMQ